MLRLVLEKFYAKLGILNTESKEVLTTTKKNDPAVTRREHLPLQQLQDPSFNGSKVKHPIITQLIEEQVEAFDLINYLKVKNLELIANRKKGGTLWVIGDNDLFPLMDELRKLGFRFLFKREGGRTTKRRPAWCFCE